MKVFKFRVVMEVPDNITERHVRNFIFNALGTSKYETVQDIEVYGIPNPMATSEVRSVTNMARIKGEEHGKED